MSIVHTEALTKIYGSDGQRISALDDVNLAVEEGEFLAIMGPWTRPTHQRQGMAPGLGCVCAG
jgi:predicted ABC-type transport system involved in lysophospholipase L1 biosynthesis ATPase subunit